MEGEGDGRTGPQDCIFCDIVAGAAESTMVHTDEQVVAFMDIRPVTPGHLLVVPRAHDSGLTELAPELGAKMWTVAHRLARALRCSGLRCEGVNLFLADGEAAFQEVFHVHLHVFPRFAGDSFRLDADWRTAERSTLEETGRAVRAGLAA